VQEAADARAILGQLTEFTLSAVVVRERKAYRDAMLDGCGVVALGHEKAAAEIAALAREIYPNAGAA